MTSDCLAQAVHRQARDGGGALEHDGCMQVLTTAPSPPHRYVDKSDLPEPKLRELEKEFSSEVGKEKKEEEDFTA